MKDLMDNFTDVEQKLILEAAGRLMQNPDDLLDMVDYYDVDAGELDKLRNKVLELTIG